MVLVMVGSEKESWSLEPGLWLRLAVQLTCCLSHVVNLSALGPKSRVLALLPPHRAPKGKLNHSLAASSTQTPIPEPGH